MKDKYYTEKEKLNYYEGEREAMKKGMKMNDEMSKYKAEMKKMRNKMHAAVNKC